MMMQKIKNERGMTLIEILIVLAIVGSIMGVIGSQVMDRFQKSKVRETKIILNQVSQSLQMYYADCNKMPSALTGLLQATDDCANWGPEPYIKKDQIKDAWGHPLVYEATDGTNFTLKSLGKDGREGGAKYDKDISLDEEEKQ